MTLQRRPGALKPLRELKTPRGLPSLEQVVSEFDQYIRIIMGDEDTPADFGHLTLMEIASAYYGRALEIEGLIYRGERSGQIPKNSEWYKFRTGELQSYLTIFKHAEGLGSRRLSEAQMK